MRKSKAAIEINWYNLNSGLTTLMGSDSISTKRSPPSESSQILIGKSIIANQCVALNQQNQKCSGIPISRQSCEALTLSLPSVNDSEAFPSLGLAAKCSKKLHGKRGYGHVMTTRTMFQVLSRYVRLSTSPAPPQKGLLKTSSSTGGHKISIAATAIPPPEHMTCLRRETMPTKPTSTLDKIL